MCGVVGVFGAVALQSDAPAIVERMTDRLAHRGPDSSGLWLDDRRDVVLGHRRLSVIDTSDGGAQPMLSESGRWAMAYNGEVYNFLDLRRQLQQLGVRFASSSDTEVLLAAIEMWGLESALERVDGMFAIALWDRDRHELTLVRDRFGEKPMFVGNLAGSIGFASEASALCVHPSFDDRIDPDAVALYLRYKVVPAPFSIYANARKIEPGTYEVFDTRSSWDLPAKRVRWYAVDRRAIAAADNPFVGSPEEAVRHADGLIRTSVRRRMISDVPLGAFLSGGIDSRVVAATMAATTSTPVTFTIGSDDPDYDETALAARTASVLGCEHHHLPVSASDAAIEIPTLQRLVDEPFGDSSLLPTMLVSRLAVGSVTVALSGDGGDEVFGGYERYRWIPLIEDKVGRVPFPIRRAIGSGIGRIPEGLWGALDRRGGGAPRVRRMGQKVAKAGAAIRQRTSVEREFRVLEHWTDAHAMVVGAADRSDETGWRRVVPLADIGTAMAVRDTVGYLPDDILAKVDRAAMSVSLETRVPFLEPSIIEFGFSLPPDLRFRDGRSKWVLREVLGRYLPTELVDAPKAGFGLPIDTWLRSSLKDWAGDLLSPSNLRTHGLVPDRIVDGWKRHRSGSVDLGSELWTVLMLLQWMDQRH